jgi:4'-phosphopantetheinyl transferase
MRIEGAPHGRVSRQLRPGQVDVWLTSLQAINPVHERACLCLLSDDERARWQRFLVPHAQLQYLVTRVLVRTTLSQYAGIPAAGWRFETNGHGRPRLSPMHGVRNLHFNVSNTTGLVVCAVARHEEIGVDIEFGSRDVDIDRLAESVFAPAELADVRGAGPEDQLGRFYAYWTLKEAYIKARGVGLSLPLDAFWFELDRPSPILRVTERAADVPERWRFYRYAPTFEHIMAVAVATPPGAGPSISLRWVDPVQGLSDREHDRTAIIGGVMQPRTTSSGCRFRAPTATTF